MRPRDLSQRGFAEKIVRATTSIDARAARSAWTRLRHPGELTVAWQRRSVRGLDSAGSMPRSWTIY